MPVYLTVMSISAGMVVLETDIPCHVWTAPVWQEAKDSVWLRSGAVMYPAC